MAGRYPHVDCVGIDFLEYQHEYVVDHWPLDIDVQDDTAERDVHADERAPRYARIRQSIV